MIHRELLSILPVRYLLNSKSGTGKGLPREETDAFSSSDLFGRMICADVHPCPAYFAERGVTFVLLIRSNAPRSPQRRFPVSAFWRYRVSLQRKKRCQQIIGLNDESFSIAVRIHAKKKSVLGEMFGDVVRPALCV